MASFEEVRRRVLEKYRSLEKPDFHWVKKAYERGPLDALRSALSSRFEIADITDLNFDVSFVYDLTSIDGEGAWTLKVSMVGPYATLVRHDPALEAIVDGARDAASPPEAFIVESCASAGYELLSRDLLNTRLKLRLFDTEPERVRVYQALFSDTDFLPGEYETTG